MMDFFSSILGIKPQGHWDNWNRLHTWQYPQVGCPACEAEGWIPATQPAPPMATCQQAPDSESTPDDTPAYLAMAVEDIERAIAHLSAACRDARVDESLGEFTLDALRGIRAEIAAEVEARHGDSD